MKKLVLIILGFSLLSSTALASTICGVIITYPMLSLKSAHQSFNLITYDSEKLDRLLSLSGAYACVIGEETDEVYMGFKVSEIVTDGP